MVRNRLILFLLGALFFAPCLMAQSGGNLRYKKIAAQAGIIHLDSLSLVPGSFSATGISPHQYLLNEQAATLQWLQLPAADSVSIHYRVFPFSFSRPRQLYRYDSIAQFFKVAPPTTIPGLKSPDNNRLVDFGRLNYSGSFGRSLSVGNAQDPVVNSLFNLQLNGMLGDSIEMAGAITDNNIPLQPDGTTQQLNEFDQIWLQFKKRGWQVNIGDIDLREQPTNYLRFFKRQQGLAFKTENRLSPKITNKLTASGAIAKGRFTRNIFNGLEGNQGPYRLSTANGELFFVVLAGTERVFIDGVQMQRGEDQDYVINYNTAEISFTPRQLIHKDKRIQVEYEYADRNYLNALFYVGNEAKIGEKLSVNLGWYSNADARNAPINQTLNEPQKQFLHNLGDSIQQALYPVAQRDSFDVSRILYVKADTLVNGQTFSIYRYKSSYDTALYNLSFTQLGQGRGNYVPAFNAANGKVFEWVAPINGVPQGSYDAVAILVTPKKQQIFTAGIGYQLNKHTLIKGEMGLSQYDINRFSSLDKNNDFGIGYKLEAADKRKLKMGKRMLNLETGLGYEFLSQRFKALERFRSPEFLRDWGLPYEAPVADEQLPTASFKLENEAQNNSLAYYYTGYLRSDDYQGHRHQLRHQALWKTWNLTNELNHTGYAMPGAKGYFFRPSVNLQKSLPKLKGLEVGGSFLMEHQQLRNLFWDTLSASSFSFTDWKLYLQNPREKANRWSLSWYSRANKWPVGKAFVPLDVNNTLSGQLEFLRSAKHKLRVNAAYRMLTVKTLGLTNQQSENSLLGRAEYLVNIWKGAFTGNLLFETGAGQEQRRDFIYVEVPAGRGAYTWIDYDGDGIPQLNEFELAQFTDQARYVRIFTPTNDFVKAAYQTLNYSIQVSPRSYWRNPVGGWQQFLVKWVLQSSWQTNRKQISNGQLLLNPFGVSNADSNLITLQNSLANTLSFNRFSPKWGIDFTWLKNSSKGILTYGFETRSQQDYGLKLRLNSGRALTTELQAKTGRNSLVTPNPKFDNRNYQINYYSFEPRITLTRGAVLRSSLSYKFNHKQGSSLAGPEAAEIHALQLETRYNVWQSSVINGRLGYNRIWYPGAANTTVGYLMLEGLQPGNNLLWNLDFTRRLVNALEISFSYEGRKAGETRTIHTGRASLRAIL